MSSSAITVGYSVPNAMASRQRPLRLDCSAGTAYSVSLSGGVRVSGNGAKAIDGEGALLPYEIYRDSGHRQRWGSAGASQTGVGSGNAQSLPLYAANRLTPIPLGAGADVMIVTIAF